MSDVCDVCEEIVPSQYCPTCDMKFCQKCLDFVHSKTAFKVSKASHLDTLQPYTSKPKITKEEKMKLDKRKELLQNSKGYLQEVKALLNNELDYLDVSKRNVSDEEIKLLAECLTINTSCKILDLHNNEITDKGIEFLLGALLKNTTLKEIHLTSNKASDSS